MKYLIAIPCMDTMPTAFVRSLVSTRIIGICEISFAISSLIYDARNRLAHKAAIEGFDRVLWLDSDMTYPPDLMERLASHLDAGIEMVSGLYIKRKAPIEPVIYKSGTLDTPTNDPYLDYPRDALFEVAGCGFGAVMMTADLIRAVGDAYGAPFSPVPGAGEDLSFCYRVRALGRKIWCDSAIKLGHVGYIEVTEQTYLNEKERKK